MAKRLPPVSYIHREPLMRYTACNAHTFQFRVIHRFGLDCVRSDTGCLQSRLNCGNIVQTRENERIRKCAIIRKVVWILSITV